MQSQPASILIYNASAGSGKTYTLVQRFLTTMLESPHPDNVKQLLAITFTNKAVAEMKLRIVSNLALFASPEILKEPTDMFSAIYRELNLTANQLHQRAQNALQYTLHNYAFLDVETIDRFNHRLIRTFAKDLKLNHNFEVDLDTDARLNEAIDRLIASAGNDTEITDIIIDFAFEKMDDDRSWDVTYDLQNISKLLSDENHTEHLKKLETKKTTDFITLKKRLYQLREEIKKTIVEYACAFEETFQNAGLSYADFSGNYVENFISKLKKEDFSISFTAGWQTSFGEKTLYRKTEKDSVKAAFESIMQQLITLFFSIKSSYFRLQLISEVYKNLASLSLLQRIQAHYEDIQIEKNILPIAAFNRKINDEIKEQPAPFIYERLGERYRHFFIDEFQDTSRLQWQNLIPLIDNSLSQPSGRLLLVGDAKQSIYRWRGGVPEQFIDLYNCKNPFSNESKEIISLKTNYRSYDTIVEFNNNFFTHIGTFFNDETHRQLYKDGNQQEHTDKTGGFVSLTFIDAANKEDATPDYLQLTLEHIKAVKNKGFSYNDICVLIRKNDEGVAVASYLSENGIPVISEDSLLIKNCAEISFIIQLLSILHDFDNKQLKADLLYFLHSHLKVEASVHQFISDFIDLPEKAFFDKLQHYKIYLNITTLKHQPLYEICESIVDSFGLYQNASGFVEAFLNIVYDFTIHQHGAFQSFFDYWEHKKDKLSVSPPEDSDAVKVMTIHKSKGLQFPVVIFPFSDLDIYKEYQAQMWFPTSEEEFQPFDEMLISYKKEVSEFSEEGKRLYEERRSVAELDTFNLIYVAMTRAVEQLFVIGNKKHENSENNVSGFFCSFLKQSGHWQEEKMKYSFGNPDKVSKTKQDTATSILDVKFISSRREDRGIYVAPTPSELWNKQQSKAMEKGNLMHLIMADIISESDTNSAIQKAVQNGLLSDTFESEIRQTVKKILTHNDLKHYFTEEAIVMNERAIFTKTGQIIRPDRIQLINKKEITIIDYKTGIPSETHPAQLKMYEDALIEMGYNVTEKLLVYVQDEIEVVRC